MTTQKIIFDMVANAIKAFGKKEITINELDSILEDCNDLMRLAGIK
jgi:hypothetical protein